jgi:hypothetical protein
MSFDKIKYILRIQMECDDYGMEWEPSNVENEFNNEESFIET